MTLVVPVDYGGIAHANWDPAATELPVPDHGDLAQWLARGRATLRLDAATLPPELAGLPLPTVSEDDDARSLQARVRGWLQAQPEALPRPWKAVISALRKRVRVVRHADDGLTLSPEQLAHVWTPYYQAEKLFTGEVRGMGLGLAMVASLVWENGGSCRMFNRPNGPGVIVELLLPAA